MERLGGGEGDVAGAAMAGEAVAEAAVAGVAETLCYTENMERLGEGGRGRGGCGRGGRGRGGRNFMLCRTHGKAGRGRRRLWQGQPWQGRLWQGWQNTWKGWEGGKVAMAGAAIAGEAVAGVAKTFLFFITISYLVNYLIFYLAMLYYYNYNLPHY